MKIKSSKLDPKVTVEFSKKEWWTITNIIGICPTYLLKVDDEYHTKIYKKLKKIYDEVFGDDYWTIREKYL